GASQQLAHLVLIDLAVVDDLLIAGSHSARYLARHGADLTLELPHAAFTRVLGHDPRDRAVRELDVLPLESRVLELPRNEVARRDLGLLVLRVSGEFHDLHAVEQRAGDVLHEIPRADEKDFAEIERYAEIVIGERVVLRRVEHLEERTRGIALERDAQLVDFI